MQQSLCPNGRLLNGARQLFRINRLGQVLIETCLAGACLIIRVTHPGQRNQLQMPAPGLAPDHPGQLDTVQLGHVEINECHIRVRT